jgi:BirA family biotin operon repressor/biotin-[acetyl-CoA-carboxylase] ligase
MARFLSRVERFDAVGSTNDVVRDWLADGLDEVALAVADRQSAGRGRDGRTWTAPSGVALLLTLGFRPTWLAPDRVWRLAAVTSMAMADAAEATAGLAPGTVRLKWPNDLVTETPAGIRKLAGVLGESDGLGGPDPRVVIGLGVDVDWPAADFPPGLATTMTSLREIAGNRPVDREAVLNAFLDRLPPGIEALRAGRFDGAAWAERQVTTGRSIRVEWRDGSAGDVLATGVDPDSGALLVAATDGAGGAGDAVDPVVVGDVVTVRLEATTGIGV